MVAALWRGDVAELLRRGLASAIALAGRAARRRADDRADALDDVTVAELLDGLPKRTDGSSILAAKTVLAAERGTPMRWVR
jgi:hypothetical protein